MRALLVLVMLAGCAGGGTPVEHWTLDVDGGDRNIAVTLPSNYLNGLPLRSLDYRLRTTVPLDAAHRGQRLVFEIDCYHGELALLIDGHPIEVSGDPGVGWWRFAIPETLTDRDELPITLAMRRDLRSMFPIASTPRLTTLSSASARGPGIAAFNRYSAVIAAVLMAFIALLYGAQYLFGRAAESLAVALWGLLNLTTPLGMLGLPGQLMGTLAGLYILYGTLLSLVVYLRFIHLVFRLGPVSRRWFIAFAVIAVPATIAIVAGSMPAVVACWTVLNAVMVAANLYAIKRVFDVARRPGELRSDARLMGVANALTIALLFSELVVLVIGRQLFGGLHAASAGLAIQAIVQAIVVGRHHAARGRDIARTNADLQHQVAERSRELGDALRQLAHHAPGAIALAGTLAGERARFGDVTWARGVLAQVAGQLAALHARGIVHRDLKLASILVDGDTATISGADESHTVAARGLAIAQPADDIAAFGRIARELFAASPVPAELETIIGRCLDSDAAKRPTAGELVVRVRTA